LVFKKWGLNYLIKKWSVLEPLNLNNERNTFLYTNIDAEITTQYAFDINRHDIEFGVGYMSETYTLPMDEGSPKMGNTYSFNRLILKGNHQINQLNYSSIYLNGWANKFNFMTSYDPTNKTTFGFFANETTYFKTLPTRANLAFRARMGISTNNNVFLAPFVLDNYYNIRSIGNKVDRGTASLAFNFEYRQTLWENKLFGLQVVGFTDAGTWRTPSTDRYAQFKKYESICGLGRAIYLQKSLRCDYSLGLRLWPQRRGQRLRFWIGAIFLRQFSS
jgi:hypothetical protein